MAGPRKARAGGGEPSTALLAAPGPGVRGPTPSSVVFYLLDIYLAVQLEEALGARPAAPPCRPVLLLPTTLLLLLAGEVILAGPALLGPRARRLRHRGAGGGPAWHHLRGAGGRGPWRGAGGPLGALLGRGAKAGEAVESLAVLQGKGKEAAETGVGTATAASPETGLG